MNYNIFSPKGKIDKSTFIIYYILLTILYFIIGLFLYPILVKYKITTIYATILLFIVNIFVMFNYKKRIMDFTNKYLVSAILAFILTFDHILIAIFVQDNNILFYSLILLVFLIQPAVVTLLPSKEN